MNMSWENKLLLGLIGGDLLLAALHLLFSGNPHWGSVFDLNKEANLPAWFSSLQFALAGGAAIACGFAERACPEVSAWQGGRWWLAIAALMLAMSADETAQLHETLTRWIMSTGPGGNLRLYFGATAETADMLWVLLFAPLILPLLAGLAWFYWSRFKRCPELRLGAIAPPLLLALAAVLEKLEEGILSSGAYLQSEHWNVYQACIAGEETAELLAASAFVWLHLVWARRTRNGVV